MTCWSTTKPTEARIAARPAERSVTGSRGSRAITQRKTSQFAARVMAMPAIVSSTCTHVCPSRPRKRATACEAPVATAVTANDRARATPSPIMATRSPR